MQLIVKMTKEEILQLLQRHVEGQMGRPVTAIEHTVGYVNGKEEFRGYEFTLEDEYKDEHDPE